MNALSFSKLRIRLVLLVVVAILPVLIFILLTGMQMRQNVLEEARGDAMRVARLLTANQERMVEGAHQLLIVLSRLPEIQIGQDKGKAGQFLGDLLKLYPVYASFGTVTADGSIEACALPINKPWSVSDRAWFQRTRSQRDFAVGDFQISRSAGKPTLNFGYPLLDKNGVFTGALFAALDLNSLSKIASHADLPGGSSVWVVDSLGMVLASGQDSEKWVGKPLPDEPVVQAIRARKGAGSLEIRDRGKESRLCSFSPLRGGGGDIGAYVCVNIPTRIAFEKVSRTVRFNLAWLGVIAVFALGAALFLGDALFLKGINALLESAERLGRGELSARTGLGDARGEVGMLAQAFDKMAASLEQRIGERERAEEALRESNRQLALALERLEASQDYSIQRERLHALGSMASGIAHDFNNSLAPILGFTDLLLRPQGLEDKARAAKYLALIHTAASDSAQVIARLREFYRLNEAREDLDPVLLHKMIGEVVSLTEPKWKNQALANGVNIEIETELKPVPPFFANEASLREALANLIFNSVDAIQQSGRITLRTFMKEGFAIIQVVDSGSGMNEKVRARCFEPFFSTKAEQGTGLGLSMVYGVVQRHHGNVEIKSDSGRGTTVTLSLPLTKQTNPKEKPAMHPQKIPQLRILVAEDDPMVLEVVCAQLIEGGHQPVGVGDGAHALEKLSGEQFDLLITDRAMPGMNGDQLAAAIKKINPMMPVMLLTGFGDMLEEDALKDVDLVVGKPFTFNSLNEAIVKIMTGRRMPLHPN